MPENKPETEKQPQEEAEIPEEEEKKETEIVEKIPPIQRILGNSKYEEEFSRIPKGKLLKVTGDKAISRYFGALGRLQGRGLFKNFESHQRTIDGEIHGYIGRKEDFKSS